MRAESYTSYSKLYQRGVKIAWWYIALYSAGMNSALLQCLKTRQSRT